MTAAVGFREEQRILEIRMLLQPLPRPMAERLIRVSRCERQRLDEPPRAGRDQFAEGFEAGLDHAVTVECPAHVVHECGRQQFLVERPLGLHPLEDLQGVLERVPLGMRGRILPHRGQHADDRGECVKPVTGERGQRSGGIEPPLHVARNLALAREPIVRHPPPAHPPCGPKHRPPGIAATGDASGRLRRDPLPKLVGHVRLCWRVAVIHGVPYAVHDAGRTVAAATRSPQHTARLASTCPATVEPGCAAAAQRACETIGCETQHRTREPRQARPASRALAPR